MNKLLASFIVLFSLGCSHSSEKFERSTLAYLKSELVLKSKESSMWSSLASRSIQGFLKKEDTQKAKECFRLLRQFEDQIESGTATYDDFYVLTSNAQILSFSDSFCVSPCVVQFENDSLDWLQLKLSYYRLASIVYSNLYGKSMGCASFSEARINYHTIGNKTFVVLGIVDTSEIASKIFINKIALDGQSINIDHTVNQNKWLNQIEFATTKPGNYYWSGGYIFESYSNHLDTIELSGEFTVK